MKWVALGAGLGCLTAIVGTASLAAFIVLLGVLQTQVQEEREIASTPSSSPSPTPPPGGGAAEPPPDSGSLADIVLREVGPYELSDARRLPQLVALGATDAIRVEYQTSAGDKIVHTFTAWSDQDRSLAWMGAVARDLVEEKGFQQTHDDPIPIRTTEGVQVGLKLILRDGDHEDVLWTNHALASIACGPVPDAHRFEEYLPY